MPLWYGKRMCSLTAMVHRTKTSLMMMLVLKMAPLKLKVLLQLTEREVLLCFFWKLKKLIGHLKQHCWRNDWADDNTARPFIGLETTYLQQKHFKEELVNIQCTCNYKEPIEKRLGRCLKRKRSNGQIPLKFCWNCAYYVPLLESLQRLLSIDWVLEEVHVLCIHM